MDQDQLWKTFEKSGRVQDYLNYRQGSYQAVAQEAPKNVIEHKRPDHPPAEHR